MSLSNEQIVRSHRHQVADGSHGLVKAIEEKFGVSATAAPDRRRWPGYHLPHLVEDRPGYRRAEERG